MPSRELTAWVRFMGGQEIWDEIYDQFWIQPVRYLTETVHVMKDGFVVEQGPTNTVLSKPTHEYTQRLLASVLA